MPGDGLDLDALREKEFPWSVRGDVIYLNSAGTGALPHSTALSLQEWATARMTPWRTTDHDVVFPALTRTRELCARLIGASPPEIGLVPNTSFGLSLAARALPLKRGDVVLVSDGEFPSLVYAWQAIAQERGIELRLVPRRDGLLDEEALVAALDGPGVRAVTVSWVSFATGYRLDLQRLSQLCRQRNMFLVVDAMQGLGPAVLDVGSMGADIVACGGYKWLLSPWGTAFVYVRQALIPTLTPPIVGWFIGPASEDYSRLLDYELRFFDTARRFEVMTLPAQDLAAMGTSLGLLLALGPATIEGHVRRLMDRIVDWARDRRDCRLVTPSDPSRRAGIASIAVSDPRDTSCRLRAANVVHSLREGTIRLAPYIYNTAEDVDTALRIIGGGR